MERRKFLKGAAIGATGAALAAPAVAGGHGKTMTGVATWGRDSRASEHQLSVSRAASVKFLTVP